MWDAGPATAMTVGMDSITQANLVSFCIEQEFRAEEATKVRIEVANDHFGR